MIKESLWLNLCVATESLLFMIFNIFFDCFFYGIFNVFFTLILKEVIKFFNFY